MEPDLIFWNGQIVTVDAQFSVQQAIALRGEMIVAVGSNDEVRQLAGAHTHVVDLGGKTVSNYSRVF